MHLKVILLCLTCIVLSVSSRRVYRSEEGNTTNQTMPPEPKEHNRVVREAFVVDIMPLNTTNQTMPPETKEHNRVVREAFVVDVMPLNITNQTMPA
jgi:hypothetical protein